MKYLWELRGFCVDASHPITPSMLSDWCRDMGVVLTRPEKGIIYSMDKAFRAEYPKTVAHYAEIKARRNKGA